MKYLLDMDEVLVGCNKTIFSIFKVDASIGEWEQIPGVTEEQVLKKIDNFDFWFNLPKMPWADDLVELIDSTNHGWAFLSCPTHNPECWAGKAAWINKHYPQHFDRLILTREKWRLATRSHCLIDDRRQHIDAFEKRGGKAIRFPSMNGHYAFSEIDMKDPVNYVRKIISKIETQIITRY